jgi:hypothetical protein
VGLPQRAIQRDDLPAGTALGTAVDTATPVQGAHQGGDLAGKTAFALPPLPTLRTGARRRGLRGPAGEFVLQEATRQHASHLPDGDNQGGQRGSLGHLFQGRGQVRVRVGTYIAEGGVSHEHSFPVVLESEW